MGSTVLHSNEREDMDKQAFLDKMIVHLDETWKVIGVGAQRDGKTFCHMASTHRGCMQKNGWILAQINDWVDTELLEAAQ